MNLIYASCITLVIVKDSSQLSRNELQKCKNLFDCLGLLHTYPVIYKMVLNEFSNRNLTTISLLSKMEFLHKEMKNVLGVMNVRKRLFKEKVIILVKRILMDLRQHVNSINKQRSKTKTLNMTSSEIEHFQKLAEEFTAIFNAVDINFNRLVKDQTVL